MAFIRDTCLLGCPEVGKAPGPVGWSPLDVLAPWLLLRVQTVAVVNSKAGCVWSRGGELGSGRETRENFTVVSCLIPSQTHCHQGPESLGEGDGTDQIFPLSPQLCNMAHLISPSHPEGNSSPKSGPEFSLWPASSVLMGWGASGVRGHLWDSLLRKGGRGLLVWAQLGQLWGWAQGQQECEIRS